MSAPLASPLPTPVQLLRRWVVDYFNGHNQAAAREFIAPCLERVPPINHVAHGQLVVVRRCKNRVDSPDIPLTAGGNRPEATHREQ